jgi:hypothetical protein
VLLGSVGVSFADHNLREIERYCEVEWDGSEWSAPIEWSNMNVSA